MRSAGGRAWRVVALVAAAGVTAALATTTATAQAQPSPAPAPASSDELPRIRITDPGRDLFRLAVPRADGDRDLAGEATGVLTRDLDIVGLFRLLDPTSFPAALLAEGLGFSSALWGQVGAQGVAKLRITRTDGGGVTVEGRLYQMGRGEAPVLTRTYRGGAPGDGRALAHAWANDVIAHFTGQPGVFGSRIAFAQTGRGRAREIATVDMDGARMAVVTRMGSECLLPAFAPSGGEISFTSFLRGNPDLWIVSAAGGRARRVSRQPGLNTGAVWAPDGRSLALTLSHEGNSEIYRIGLDGQVMGRLTRAPGIDSSPSFSPDGAQIAFVSDRQGTPQIWLMPSGGGAGQRLTFQGRYNQTPRFSPRADRPQIAFTGRDERGVFDVFIYDVKAGTVDRLTQNQGSNYDPAWSPDGRLIVYASSRGGLFVANPDTRTEVQIWKGGASSPSWGPAPGRAR